MNAFIQTYLNRALNFFNTFIIWRYGRAVGDQFLMTGAIRAIYEEYGLKSVVLTNFPEFFFRNPHVVLVINLNHLPRLLVNFVLKVLRRASGSNIANFLFQGSQGYSLPSYMRISKSKDPLWMLHTRHWSRRLDLVRFKNELFLSHGEINLVLRRYKLVNKSFALVNPISKDSYTPVKSWSIDRFQEVVSSLPNLIWVQVGLATDPKLRNCFDLRGKTSLRELAILVNSSKFVLACEGLLNHLASASPDVTSFVLMSGFTPAEYVKHSNTVIIARSPQVSCAPCWLTTSCPEEKKWCTEDITVNDVLNVLVPYCKN